MPEKHKLLNSSCLNLTTVEYLFILSIEDAFSFLTLTLVSFETMTETPLLLTQMSFPQILKLIGKNFLWLSSLTPN